MKLKLATAEDSHTLARIHVESWRAAYRDIVPHEKLEEFTVKKREQSFYDALVNPSSETYLVKSGRKYIGILTIGHARDPDLNAGDYVELYTSHDN